MDTHTAEIMIEARLYEARRPSIHRFSGESQHIVCDGSDGDPQCVPTRTAGTYGCVPGRRIGTRSRLESLCKAGHGGDVAGGSNANGRGFFAQSASARRPSLRLVDEPDQDVGFLVRAVDLRREPDRIQTWHHPCPASPRLRVVTGRQISPQPCGYDCTDDVPAASSPSHCIYEAGRGNPARIRTTRSLSLRVARPFFVVRRLSASRSLPLTRANSYRQEFLRRRMRCGYMVIPRSMRKWGSRAPERGEFASRWDGMAIQPSQPGGWASGCGCW
jgi:hypothetical protein